MDFVKLLKKLEQNYRQMLPDQEMDETSPFYGMLYQNGGAGNESIITTALPLYIHPESGYYRDPEVLRRMNLDADYFLRMQLPGGLLSLHDCNLNSASSTGFKISNLMLSVRLIDRLEDFPELKQLQEKLLTFMKRTIPGMLTGGFHTPNHRWVITAALAELYQRFGDERLKERAYAFLGEGLDMNEAGEWTERSNGTYNTVCDNYMIRIGDIFGEESAIAACRKNLTMMMQLLHPGNLVATEYSSRQDRGAVYHLNERYCLCYLEMAIRDQNPYFADMARRAAEDSDTCGFILHYLDLHRDRLDKLPAPKSISDRYTVLLNEGQEAALNQKKSEWGNPVLRFRNGKLSVSVMAGQQDVLYFQYGRARAASIRLPLAWFGMGGVSFPKIEKRSETEYRLSTPLYGWYNQVQPRELVAQYHGNWKEMNRNVPRKQEIGAQTQVEVLLTLRENGLDLDITADQMADVFAQLVCQFDPEGTLLGDRLEAMPGGTVRPADGHVVYRLDGDCISVTGTACGHRLGTLRGDQMNRDMQNVVFNALSPRNWHFELRGYEEV